MTRRARRVVTSAVAVVLALAVAWACWAYAVIGTPTVQAPAPVDAVVVLGGLTGPDRTETAMAMVGRGLTDTVVISTPPSADDLTLALCDAPPAGVRVICFDPDPSTTQGEAQEVGRLAAAGGWTRVAFVTSVPHISRARLIVGRCFPGTVLMVPDRVDGTLAQWAWQLAYQTGAYVKAEVFVRSC